MEEKRPLQSIPDDELLHRLAELMGQSRRVEAEAYLRISAARASREHPMLLTMLADGRLHLTAIAKLARHLTRENREGLLEGATHRSKRQIEEQIAEIAPRPDIPGMVRKLPERGTLPTASLLVVSNRGENPTLELRPDGVAAAHTEARQDAPSSASVVQPLSPGRYKVQFTASAELHHKLERLKALMGSIGRDGDLAAVIEQAVTEKLERLEARRLGRTRAPRRDPAEMRETRTSASPSSRHVPAAGQRAVRERDGDQCRYVDEQGRRCKQRDHLEFHHRHPFGLGGDHEVSNIRLMCHAHNAYRAECDYGREAMGRHRRPRSRASPQPVDSH